MGPTDLGRCDRPIGEGTFPMTDFLFIESNTTGTGAVFIRQAVEMGYQPVLITRDPGRYRFLASPPGQQAEVQIAETRDRRQLLAAVRARRTPLAGIFTSSDTFYGTAAWLAHQLDLPAASHQAIDFCRCKVNQRTTLGDLRPHLNPHWAVVADGDSAIEAGSRIGYPVVIKPCDGTGSLMVRKCESEAEVAAHIERITQDWHGSCGHILLEEFIGGPEFSAEVFDGNLLGVTEKTLGPEPSFVEMGHLYPALGSAADEVGRAATDVARDLGLRWGPAHIEIRLSDAGARVMEVNPRLGGDFIPELIRLAQGLDPIAACIRLAAGDAIDTSTAHRQFAAIRFLRQQLDGIATVKGISSALEIPFVQEAKAYRPDTFHRVADDFTDRVGHVILAAPTRTELLDAASAAIAAMAVSVGSYDTQVRSCT